ncbi:MAG TPA: CHASE3 domain-containing protein [Vicinamibacterales bacterium]|nr:CHASE3 domain-containing protein [Vicinamibacterales bacterium]
MWTFGKKVAAGFAVAFALLAVIGLVAYRSIDVLTKTSALVGHTHQVLEEVAHVLADMTAAETGQRGFVITGDPAFLDPYQIALASVLQDEKDLRGLTTDNPNQQRRLDEAEPLIATKLAELKKVIDLRRGTSLEAATKVIAAGEGREAMDGLRRVLGQMDAEERGLLKDRAADADAAVSGARVTIIGGTVAALLFICGVAWFLTHSLSQQIGTAVGQVQSSSAELQAAATQQATGSKEQATAMSEISTTISELLATSRQITQSAQRVAQIAEQTAGGARSGEETVDTAHAAIVAIRRQVDLIVNHMLELGRKSQQIGAVLEIVSELAEQTNILSINATIEAAGAGEAGKRFAVVAEEIRKLSDRVAASAREIRGLIDDVRSAVNTTVMATETGSKAVDAGSRQFDRVAASFKQIANLVVTTTEAAREIELSTKQQMTAVEQVNVAMANVSQSSRETEASSGQTQQTASELASLSRDLLRLVQPQASA